MFLAFHTDDLRGLSHVPAPQTFTGEDYVTKEPREHLHERLKFFCLHYFSLHELFIPRCMLMFKVGEASPGHLRLEDL